MLHPQIVDFHMGNREIHVFFNKRAIFGGIFLANWNIFLESYISETWIRRATCWSRGGKNEKTCWWASH